MDLLWYGMEHQVPVEEVAAAAGMTPEQVGNAFEDFQQKIRATAYLRTPPLDLNAAGAPLAPTR
jgi:NAD+ synthase